MGKRPVRRPVEEKIADDDLAALAQRGVLARQRRLLREHIRDTADRILESLERQNCATLSWLNWDKKTLS